MSCEPLMESISRRSSAIKKDSSAPRVKGVRGTWFSIGRFCSQATLQSTWKMDARSTSNAASLQRTQSEMHGHLHRKDAGSSKEWLDISRFRHSTIRTMKELRL